MGVALESPLQEDDFVGINMGDGAMVTALRMRFPADKEFVFEVDFDGDRVSPDVSSIVFSAQEQIQRYI